ncbi:DUF2911 domain-containing protein [Maribacter sp. PR1]|uniref:DUF2911 domain-containing protein n=1 Tax=Maribacter cobaltidurans TaxID=1178778 RepID=A0ABU7IXA6_9FLAO|nr:MULTISPECIES: DUF2911 domain-containing protein [Maribacter]MDC6390036.1 DUF2911 domain-containing protein [Maribacter sp. PR1]MEE1977426.1 DUF2911 domain-containing protein [Maribacter cobaltidurans]
MKVVGLFILLLLWTTIGWSQITHPKASPFTRIEQEVGLSKISLEYSRPAVRNRKVFGIQADGKPALVPYGRIWRVGANESTKITFDSDVKIEGNDLPKGTYALYIFPYENQWEIVFHKNTSHWGDGRDNYNPEEDALKVSVLPLKTLAFQENILIYFDELQHDSAQLIIHWASTKVQVSLSFDTTSTMDLEIQQKLQDNPSAQTYYEVARYYQEQGIRLDEALSYLEKALEKGGGTYYFYRVKSLVEADLGNYKDAIVTASKSLRLADAEKKDEFVRLNQKSIKLWKSKL